LTFTPVASTLAETEPDPALWGVVTVFLHCPQTLWQPVKFTATTKPESLHESQPPPADAGQKSVDEATGTGSDIETPPFAPPRPEAYWDGHWTVQELEETL
jgi:hypothetical protein